MNNKSSFAAVAGVLLISALLTGCSTKAEPIASPSPTINPMTPAEAKAAYKVIAKTSCETAQNIGVVEQTGDTTVVMTPKDKNYKDFNAAYFTKPDKYQLIWELTGLAACADWYEFSMADEAGKPAPIDVTFDSNDGTFATSQTFDGVTYKAVVTVASGKIATSKTPATGDLTTLKYGGQTAEDQNILVTAVDAYLATID